MLSAREILGLLIEDDPPVEPTPPGDPNQQALPFNPDELIDPRRELERYTKERPLAIPGSGIANVFTRLENRLTTVYHRDPNRLKLTGRGNTATSIIRYPEDGRIAVRYHNTDVVTAFPDGTVVVDSGGFRPGGANADMGWTMPTGTHTLIRINAWLDAGWQIYALPIRRNDRQRGEGGNWYWYNRNRDGRWAYTDGDKILPNGSLQPQRWPDEDEFTPVKYEPPG